MSGNARKPATYDDILALPEHLTGEIVDGELFVSPRPGPKHANASSVLGSDLVGGFHGRGGDDRPGGWWILDEPELHLRGELLVPDIAGWRRSRLPRLPEGAAFELAPDWVCEVMSPGKGMRIDRLVKMPAYARHRVSHLWLVDPVVRSVEVYRLQDDGHWLLLGTHGDGKARLEPFDAIELDVSRWWPEDEDDPTSP
jgi:Uma2 family endonuclease